jgi:hypothetical protein
MACDAGAARAPSPAEPSVVVIEDDDAPAGGGAGGAAAAALPPLPESDIEVHLLVLDPSTTAGGIRDALRPPTGGSAGGRWEQAVKRGLHTLRKPVYEVVVVLPPGAPEALADPTAWLSPVIDEEHVWA